MKDQDLILRGWRKCCLYCCIAGVVTLLSGLIPGIHCTDFGAGMGVGEIVFGVSAYVLSRFGVMP